MTSKASRALWLAALLAVVIATAWFYRSGFDGFWMGDDYGHVHRAYQWKQDNQILTGMADEFTRSISAGSTFYRPASIAWLTVPVLWADGNYGGWFAVNLIVHLCNILLIGLVAMALLQRTELANARTPWLLLGPALFAFSPLISEGVYWIAAHADGWVTFLSLLALWVFLREGKATWLAPPLILCALLFKESAMVFVLQLTVLAIALRLKSRHQRAALVASWLVLAGYVGLRMALIGSVAETGMGDDSHGLVQKLLAALADIPAWWGGFQQFAPGMVGNYGALLAAVFVLAAAMALSLRSRAVGTGVLLCLGGILLATLMGVGGLSATGSGGRLLYTPFAWLALLTAVGISAGRGRFLFVTAGVGIFALICGMVVLQSQLAEVSRQQRGMADMARSLPALASTHPDGILLIVPDSAGAIVLLRNGLGGLALEPVQPSRLLHEVLPTLNSEVEQRYDAFQSGLLTQLRRLKPEFADSTTITQLLQPAPAAWPRWVACWSPAVDHIQMRKIEVSANAKQQWVADVRGLAMECGL